MGVIKPSAISTRFLCHLFIIFAISKMSTAAPKDAVCFKCVTKSPNFAKDKASCVKAVQCDIPGQCFKAIFDGELTIRGCPLGSEANIQDNACDRIPAQMTGSLAARFNEPFAKSHFDASCGNKAGSKKPQVLLCRGRACNGAAEFMISKLGGALALIAATFGPKMAL